MTHRLLLLLAVCALTQGCGILDYGSPLALPCEEGGTCPEDMGADAQDNMPQVNAPDMRQTTPDMRQTTPVDMSVVNPQDMRTEPDPPTCSDASACIAGDGCCPSNCDFTSDDDCNVDCRDYDSWPKNWAATEAEIVSLVNVERARGANCGREGSFPPTGPVSMNRELQIAARCHSIDMVSQGDLSHTGSDGSAFFERTSREGYQGSPRGENVAAGNASAAATVQQWMGSDGHCRNIMVDGIDRMGLGYFTGNVRYTHYWTMVTGVGGASL